MKKYFLTLATLLLVTSCATQKTNQEIIGKPKDLYTKGMDAIYAKKFKTAINVFEELERQHPYSEYSRKSNVMIMFAQFENEDYDEAIFTAERFIKSNIGYKDLDYVYYMRGLAYYYRISDVKREQSYTHKALTSFQELIARFPDSKYSVDAKQKIILCYDQLAGKEMAVGRFYQEQGNMLAAVNRFQTVITNYQKSTQTPEALYRVAEIYISLGLEKEAVRALSILGYNYSGESIWYKRGYELLTNIDKYEEKYQSEGWFVKLKKGVKKSFE